MPTSIFPIQVCTYTWNYPYETSLNTTANSVSISQVEQAGVVFDITPPLFLDDYININAQLQGLSITQGGSIGYSFDGSQADLQCFNLYDQITQIFLIQNINGVGGGSPIPFQMPVSQQLCQFINDPGFIYGCTDPDAVNYDPLAQVNTGVCAYEPETITDKLICAVIDEGYEFAMLMKAGKLTQDQIDCRYLESGFNLAVVNSVASHVYAGTVLIPAALPQAATYAMACVDFTGFSDGAFISVTATVDGNSLVDPTGQFGVGTPFWSTKDDFGTALAADITAYAGSNGGYTATYDDVLNKFCVVAPATGEDYNGVLLDIFFTQDLFQLLEEIPTSNGFQVEAGDYDPLNQNVIFAQGNSGLTDAQTFKVITPPTDVATPEFTAPQACYQVIYNPNTTNFLVLNQSNQPYIYDNGYAYIGLMTTGLTLQQTLIRNYSGFISGTSLWYGNFRDAGNPGAFDGRRTGILARENDVSFIGEGTAPLPLRDVQFKNGKTPGSWGVNYATVPTVPANIDLTIAPITPCSLDVTGAIDDGGGLVQLVAVDTTGFILGDTIVVSGVVGTNGLTAAANGTWVISFVDATHITLTGSVFPALAVYTSGGLINSTIAITVDIGLLYVAGDFVKLQTADGQHGIIGNILSYNIGTGATVITITEYDNFAAIVVPIAINEFTLDLYIAQGLNHIKLCPWDGTIWGVVGNGAPATSNHDGVYMFDPATVTLPCPANNMQLANLASITTYAFDLCFVEYGATQEVWVFGLSGKIAVYSYPVSAGDSPVTTIDVSVVATVGYLYSGVQHSSNGYVYMANASGSQPSIFMIIDPASRSFIQAANAPILLQNHGRSLVEDTSTGIMYFAEDQFIASLTNYAFVAAIALDQTANDRSRNFSGGQNEIIYNRDELQQDEDNSCYTDAQAEVQEQWAMDNIKGCCN